MRQTVNSKSIKEITKKAAHALPKHPEPRPQDILFKKKNRGALVYAFQKAQLNPRKMPSVSGRDLERANNALNHIPQGFDLASLVYTRLPKGQNKAVYKEFSSTVKPRFMMFLAKYQKDDLKKLGICDYGIKRMSRGLEPSDKDGHLYALSVDHVIERSGSGKMGQEKSIDPLLTEFTTHGTLKTYPVNHFSNLMLLPDKLHFERKNVVNEIQKLPSTTSDGASHWAMMLIPDRTKETGLYSYVPQKGCKNAFNIVKKKMTVETRLSHCFYTIDRLLEALKEDTIDQKRVLNLTNDIQRNLNAIMNVLNATPKPKKSKQFEERIGRLVRLCESRKFNTLLKHLKNHPAKYEANAAMIILNHKSRYEALRNKHYIPPSSNDNRPARTKHKTR